MKIAIISNCQGDSLAACLREMNNAILAEFFLVTKVQDGTIPFADLLNTHDFVFMQRLAGLAVSEEFAHKVHYFPSFGFAAFHPDMTYLRAKKIDGVYETVFSPMAHYNSALVIYGYVKGLSSAEIVALFNKQVYKKLGYLDAWAPAKRDLLAEGRENGMPLEGLFANWEKRGCFMYSFNHPELHIIADVASELLKKIGAPILSKNPGRYLPDILRGTPVWPIYPEIAAQYGLDGDYAFKNHGAHQVIYLEQFVAESVAIYSNYVRESLDPINFSIPEFEKLLGPFGPGNTISAPTKSANPYADLPARQFWKKSVASVPVGELDPVSTPRFTFHKDEKIATAGSCFAQHIARTLSANGFNYYVTETAPPEQSAEAASAHNFGVFSARYGNLYTARQLLQLVKRATGEFVPIDASWTRADGKLVDPFRPQIEPDGFDDIDALARARVAHFDAVNRLLSTTEVFVFTLGLTEGWRAKADGAVFPLAPGVAGGVMDFAQYEFVNFTVEEIVSDMNEFLGRLWHINPKCKVMLTVSPVPLIATFEPKHALVATTYSKSVLRVAADALVSQHNLVDYFPSYEIITGTYNRGVYFDDDLRNVKPEGVAHVMRVFLKHYMNSSVGESPTVTHSTTGEVPARRNALFDIVCDEEAIAKM